MKTQTDNPYTNDRKDGAAVASLSPAPYRRTLAASLILLAMLLAIHIQAIAQQTQAPGSQSFTSGPTTMHGTMFLALTAAIDSKKLKAGDEVDGRTAALISLRDGTTIPRGMKVIGHVVEAKARGKGDAESSLAIVFESINLPDGKSLAINGVIQAVGPNPNAEVQTGGGMGYGGMTMDLEMPASPKFVPRPVQLLNQESRGVIGIKNLQLGPEGVLTSDAKSVKLDSGYQILLNVRPSVSAALAN